MGATLRGVVAVFKIINDNTINNITSLISSTKCTAIAISKGYLMIDINKFYQCENMDKDAIIKFLTTLTEEGKIKFYSYVSTGAHENYLKILNKLHQEIAKKDKTLFFITDMRALMLNHGHKKEYIISYYTTSIINRMRMYDDRCMKTVLITTDYNLNIKKIIENYNGLYELIPIKKFWRIPFYEKYGTLINNFFILKSIIHSRHYTLKNTTNHTTNPHTWQLTILNPHWYYALKLTKTYSTKFGLTITHNDKLWVKNDKLNIKKTYNVELKTTKEMNKNHTSILTEVFSIGEAWLWLNLFQRRLVEEINDYENLITNIMNQISGFEPEAKTMFEVTKKLMSKTNYFKLFNQGTSGLQELLSNIRISGLFLELSNEEGKWKLPVLTKFDFGEKQIYTYNVANAMLMNIHLKLCENTDQGQEPKYIIEKNKIKPFTWEDIGVDRYDNNVVMKILNIAKQLQPVRKGHLFKHKNKGFKVYRGSEFTNWNDLVKVPLFRIAVKMGDDVITFDGNSFVGPEHGVHIFSDKNTTVIFSGYKAFEVLKKTVEPVQLRKCARL